MLNLLDYNWSKNLFKILKFYFDFYMYAYSEANRFIRKCVKHQIVSFLSLL